MPEEMELPPLNKRRNCMAAGSLRSSGIEYMTVCGIQRILWSQYVPVTFCHLADTYQDKSERRCTIVANAVFSL